MRVPPLPTTKVTDGKMFKELIRRALWLGALVIIASLSIACADSQPATEVTLGEMARDYMQNAARADEKYSNPLMVSARINEIGSNGIIRLSGGGRNHVEARMKNKEDLLMLNRGDTTTLRCERVEGSTDSLGAFIDLKDCEIWQDDKTDAASSNSPPVSKDTEDSPVSVVATMEAQNALALLPTSAYERVTANSGSTDDYVSSYKLALRWALLRGQTEAYAVGYAISRAQGSTDDQSKSYAEQFATLVEEGHSFDSAMRIADASINEASSDSQAKSTLVPQPKPRLSNDNWDYVLSEARGAQKSHIGSSVDIRGSVTQVISTSATESQFAIKTSPELSIGENTIILAGTNLQLAEDQWVRVQGVLHSYWNSEHTFGTELNLPVVDAHSVTVITREEVFPAIRAVPVDQSISQHGLIITLEKLEITDSETRLYIHAKNTSPDKAFLYAQDAVLVQGTQQIKRKYVYDQKVEEPDTTLVSGTETQGVLLFEPASPDSSPVKLVWEGPHTDDYSLTFDDWEWKMSW